MAAEKIRTQLGPELVECFNISTTPIITASFYPYLIFGIPTWDYGELQEDWEEIWEDINELDLSGKRLALYGLGDQIGYPEWFLDAMGYLHSKLIARGASACGYWPVSGYQFEASKALTADGSHFVGLALDDENEFDQSPDRIARWCTQIRREFGL
jgi:flavodoxin II